MTSSVRLVVGYLIAFCTATGVVFGYTHDLAAAVLLTGLGSILLGAAAGLLALLIATVAWVWSTPIPAPDSRRLHA